MSTCTSVSVIVPTHDREAALRRVLEAWDEQYIAGVELELIVVDDGSSDGTDRLLRDFAPRRYRLQTVHQQNAGPAAARNRGLSLARGELVFFTGDDIVPRPRLLAEHLEAHRRCDDPGVAILGRTSWPEASPTTTTMRHIDGIGAQQFSYAYMTDGEEYDFRHFYTSNVSVRRELLRCEPEGFSTDFRRAAFEDAEYSYRLSFHGLRIVYRAAARADHHHYYDVAGFCRRQQACGEMAAVLYEKHPELRKWTGLGDLEWMALTARGGETKGIDRETLAEARNRLVRLAAFYDHAEARPVHGLLLALFRYAYLEGLAGAVFGEEAPAVLGTALRREVLPAVDRFHYEMRRDGIPVPAADSTFLLRLS